MNIQAAVRKFQGSPTCWRTGIEVDWCRYGHLCGARLEPNEGPTST